MAAFFWISLAILASVAEAMVKGKLEVECGSFPNTPATIRFTGDAKAVFAFGENGICRFSESPTKLGNFSRTIGYKKSDNCKFTQTAPDRDNFVLAIETRTLHVDVESEMDEKYLVSCNYMRYSKVIVKFDIVSQFKPPEMKLFNKAKQATSSFQVYLTNIQGGKLKGAMAERRIVKMRSRMFPAKTLPGKTQEVGFQPVQCIAQPDRGGKSLVILSDGCGTGFPWTNKQGFTMRGLVGDSPKFRLFKLHKRQGIKISCDFVVCTKTCNQNSCAAARKPSKKGKRSVDQEPEIGDLIVRTSVKVLVPDSNSTTAYHNVDRTFNGEDSSLGDGQEEDMRSTFYGNDRATVFSTIFISSSIVLVATIFLTTFVLSKIQETHRLILQCKNSSK